MSGRADAIRRFFRARLKFFAGLGLAALVAALAAGTVSFYRYRTGPEYAFKTLRAALVEQDKAKLATLLDFRSLSEDIVREALAVYPQAAANETQRQEMGDEAQRLALKALAVGKEGKPEAVPPRKLFEPVPFVPEDVVAQIVTGMKLEKTDGEIRILSRFTHNGLQTNFPLRLLMERRRDGWLATRLLNARELVVLYKEAADAIRAEDEAKLAEKNEKILSKMRTHFASPRCLVSANLTGGRQEAMLVVKVTANNTDPATLHNVNLSCDVRAGDGALLYSRHLDAVQRVLGGGEFSNTWVVLLDPASEEAVKLLQAGPLSCSVEPRVMSVGVGEILYPRKD